MSQTRIEHLPNNEPGTVLSMSQISNHFISISTACLSLLIIPTLQTRNFSKENLSHLPKITQLV